MRLPSNGIPKFDGIDDLRRLVQAPPRVLDDVEQERVSDLVERLYDVGERSMPSEYGARDLAHALATVDRPGVEAARERAQVRAAWNVRFATDPLDQAAIGARIGTLLDGAPATLQSQEGVAELRTLAYLVTDPALRPAAIGRGTRDQLDVGIRGLLMNPLLKDGQFGAVGDEFVRMWKLARDPDGLAGWHSTIDDVARGRGELPADMTLDQLVLPAAGWEGRSTAQRMRLLDKLATLDGPPALVRSRTTNPRMFMFRELPEVRAHLSRQVDRAIRGEAPLPAGILVRDIQESWHFRRATRAQQVDVLRQQSASAKQAVFEEYADIRYQLGPAALEVGRYQVGRWLDHGLRTGAPLPAWIEAGDIVRAAITERQKAHLLSPYVGAEWAGTPEAAAASLVNARLRIHGEQMGGGVPGALAVRTSTLQMIDRNLKRIASEVEDGFEGHPDYAEVGRVESNLKLLADFQGAANARRDSAAAKLAAAESGTTVTW